MINRPLLAMTFIVLCAFNVQATHAAIAFVQARDYVPTPARSSVSATFSNTQTAGNLNVVAIAYGDGTRRVQSVVDTRGNVYVLAAGPTANGAAQAIYYAKNIVAAAAGANTITVTLDGASTGIDLRVAEYSGVDKTSPLDTTASGRGTGTVASTGSATTHTANAMLVTAGYSGSDIGKVATGFTRRAYTPIGNMLADRIAATPGSYTATATVTPSAFWIMQLITLKAAVSETQPGPGLGAAQANYSAPQGSASSVAVAFTSAQSAANTNVVAVGWRSPSVNVQSVMDTRGNVYQLAVGPTVLPGVGAHAIYYSSAIAASSASTNTVTVTFSASATTPDVRIAEYSGIDPSLPIDSIASATGNSTMSSSGTIATYAPNTLLVAANLAPTRTSGPGAGFTTRALSSPNGNILEDRTVSTTGNYNATAPLSSAGAWIMQLVAFRRAGSPACD